MADEALRALERAARAQPDDLDAGWAYARALERSGDVTRTHRELARLAGHACPEARRALGRWHWWPRLAPPPRPLPRTPSTAAVRAARIEDLPEGAFDARFSSRSVLITVGEYWDPARGELVVVDAEQLGVRWRLPIDDLGTHSAVLVDEDVVYVAGDSIYLRSGADGALLARARLGQPLHHLRIAGEGAIVHGEDGVLMVDVTGCFGAVLWQRPGFIPPWLAEPLWPARAPTRGSRREPRRAMSGGAPVEDGSSARAADERGHLLYDDSRGVSERAPDGAVRWREPGRFDRFLLADDLAILKRFARMPGYVSAHELVVVDRARGGVRWIAPLERSSHAFALGDGVVHVAWLQSERVRISSYSLVDGARVLDVDLSHELEPVRAPGWPIVGALDGAIVVAHGSRDGRGAGMVFRVG